MDVDAIGIESEQGPISATPQNGEVTTIGSELPSRLALHQNYPNPFNPETNIRFDIPLTDDGHELIGVDLTIYNTLGQRIKSLFKGQLLPGAHMVKWNGDLDNGNLAPGGTYFAVLIADQNKESIKIILLK